MKYIGMKLDGRYLIEELIGEGGMADVYRGVDVATETPIAVKILKDEYSTSGELVRRFMNESRAIGLLKHPNIVKVYDVSAAEDIHYIVMELLKGITLKEYIEQRGEPLTYKEVVHFLSQVLRALQHAHDKGIVHRDIKPQNIMILEDGSVKVMDFGIARLARSEIHTDAEQAIGSVHYISPEQAQGIDTDLRADIYSLGIMLYEMLSGKLPFEADDAVAIAVKQISDVARPLRELNPSVPEGLSDITVKAMAKDPAKRYQNALEMLRDVEEFKQNPSIRFDYDNLEHDSFARRANKMGNEKNLAEQRNTGKKRRQKKFRNKKVGLLVPVMLGITIAVAGICILYGYNLLQSGSNPFFGTYEDIELPDFTLMNYEDVKEQLRRAPLNNLEVILHEEPNAEVPRGVVFMQNPQSNNDNMRIVKSTQRLHLYVSSGVETVEVPDVTGMTQREAVARMLESGLMPYARAVQSDDVPVGMVVSTSPERGTPVQNVAGTMVTIFVSSSIGSGENTRVVPDVLGLELVQAQQAIENSQLSLGVVTEEASADYLPGQIIKQTPEAGMSITVGGDVHLVVCAGTPIGDMVIVPDLAGLDVGSAQAQLQASGLVLGAVGSAPAAGVPVGAIFAWNPPAGLEVPAGTAVDVIVGAGPPPPPETSSSSSSSESLPPTESVLPPPDNNTPNETQSSPPEQGDGGGGDVPA